MMSPILMSISVHYFFLLLFTFLILLKKIIEMIFFFISILLNDFFWPSKLQHLRRHFSMSPIQSKEEKKNVLIAGFLWFFLLNFQP